jgi:uncharacterized coiled-coil protein SlyX
MSEDAGERIARLESHLAYLERQVEEVNEVVIEQGRTITRLLKQVQLQARAMETAELERAKATNPKPPHH